MLFLDEATSALDAEMEEALYELVLRELPDAALVSIAHRDAVSKYHEFHWQFVQDERRVSEISVEQETLRYTILRTALSRPSAKGIAEAAPR
jgi:putative ATP-binding cassette transporter